MAVGKSCSLVMLKCGLEGLVAEEAKDVLDFDLCFSGSRFKEFKGLRVLL